MNEKILSMDKIFICQNYLWMEKSHLWMKVSPMEIIMDDIFICGCHPWMNSTDKDNR